MERRRLLAWESAVVMAGIAVGSLSLWIAVPLACLWVGSRVQAGTGSVGYALLAMMCAATVAFVLLSVALTRLNRIHGEVTVARGLDDGGGATALERVLVLSAVVAVLVAVVWFFGFSGSEPLPLQIGY